MNNRQPLTRRQLLKKATITAAAAFAFPYVVPSSVFGASATSNRITIGCIGVGGMGTNNMRAFMEFNDVQVVAVCDPDTTPPPYVTWATSP